MPFNVNRLTTVTPIAAHVLVAIWTNRVEIRVTDYQKHTLPVDSTCKWQHSHGIALRGVECFSADGKPAENFNDIWLCMEEEECEVTGRCALLRDPWSQDVRDVR